MTGSNKQDTIDPTAFARAVDSISDYKLLLPLGSYHMTGNGSHATMRQRRVEKPYNENQLGGFGISKKLSENAEGFIVGYKNSFNDRTVVAAASYFPLTKNIGNFEGRLGLTAGVAYTEDGSYAKRNPKISEDKFTPVAGIIATMEHIPSGSGVQSTVTPTGDRKNTTVFGFSFTQRF